MTKRKPSLARAEPPKHLTRIGTGLLKPRDLETRYGISNVTRWRWERTGKLPPRDVRVGGVPVGWRPETLDAADRGEAA